MYLVRVLWVSSVDWALQRPLCLSWPPPVCVVSHGSAGMPRFFCAPSSCSTLPRLALGAVAKKSIYGSEWAHSHFCHIRWSEDHGASPDLKSDEIGSASNRRTLQRAWAKEDVENRSHTCEQSIRFSGRFFPTSQTIALLLSSHGCLENHGFLRA